MAQLGIKHNKYVITERRGMSHKGINIIWHSAIELRISMNILEASVPVRPSDPFASKPIKITDPRTRQGSIVVMEIV